MIVQYSNNLNNFSYGTTIAACLFSIGSAKNNNIVF